MQTSNHKVSLIVNPRLADEATSASHVLPYETGETQVATEKSTPGLINTWT